VHDRALASRCDQVVEVRHDEIAADEQGLGLVGFQVGCDRFRGFQASMLGAVSLRAFRSPSVMASSTHQLSEPILPLHRRSTVTGTASSNPSSRASRNAAMSYRYESTKFVRETAV